MAEWHGDDVDAESVVEPEEGEGGAVAKVKKLKEEIAELRQAKQEYMDGWQRSKADYVNLLKRTEGDLKSAKAGGIVKAVEALLPAFDALERSKEHGELPEGFQAIAKQLESAFAGLGVSAVGAAGEKFDPNLHEALGQDAASSREQDDTITAVLEQGYTIGDKVVRPAKVRVAHFQ